MTTRRAVMAGGAVAAALAFRGVARAETSTFELEKQDVAGALRRLADAMDEGRVRINRIVIKTDGAGRYLVDADFRVKGGNAL